MSVPGSNLLKQALKIIAKQTVGYHKFTGRTVNDIGLDVSVYAPPVAIAGSFQPVPRRLYAIYGLDLQKTYATFYTSKDVLDVQRDVSGDQIAYDGKKYQCISENDWMGVDGWTGVLCVQIGPATASDMACPC